MKKKHFLILCGIACLGITLFLIMTEFKNTSLTETISLSEEYEDFIVHIRMEPVDEGFQVLRSIEYIGRESIEIQHRTPLIQVTINVDNATFTGSPVKKRMEPGYQYYPQTPLTFESLEKGLHTLYFHTQFFLEGNRIDIKTEKTIQFE